MAYVNGASTGGGPCDQFEDFDDVCLPLVPLVRMLQKVEAL